MLHDFASEMFGGQFRGRFIVERWKQIDAANELFALLFIADELCFRLLLFLAADEKDFVRPESIRHMANVVLTGTKYFLLCRWRTFY